MQPLLWRYSLLVSASSATGPLVYDLPQFLYDVSCWPYYDDGVGTHPIIVIDLRMDQSVELDVIQNLVQTDLGRPAEHVIFIHRGGDHSLEHGLRARCADVGLSLGAFIPRALRCIVLHSYNNKTGDSYAQLVSLGAACARESFTLGYDSVLSDGDDQLSNGLLSDLLRHACSAQILRVWPHFSFEVNHRLRDRMHCMCDDAVQRLAFSAHPCFRLAIAKGAFIEFSLSSVLLQDFALDRQTRHQYEGAPMGLPRAVRVAILAGEPGCEPADRIFIDGFDICAAMPQAGVSTSSPRSVEPTLTPTSPDSMSTLHAVENTPPPRSIATTTSTPKGVKPTLVPDFPLAAAQPFDCPSHGVGPLQGHQTQSVTAQGGAEGEGLTAKQKRNLKSIHQRTRRREEARR